MALTKKSVEKKVIAILAETLDRPAQGIRKDAQLVDDLGINSFTMIRVVYMVEEFFSVRVEPESIGSIRTVADIVDHIIEQSSRGT